jgi:hypothetical protein
MMLRIVATCALFLGVAHAAQTAQDATAGTRGARRAALVCSEQQCIYVANGRLGATSKYRLTGYSSTANGDVAPVADLAGPATQLDQPWGIAVDRDQDIYVSNPATHGDGYVTVYKPDATGDVAPILTIGGGASNPLCYPFGIAVASQQTTATTVYVANAGCGGFVAAFGIDRLGSVTEIGTISGQRTGLAAPWGVALGADQDIYVANYDANAITVYRPGKYGDVAPIRTIAGALTGLSGPAGLAIARGKLYVANFDGASIAVFPAHANGDVAPSAIVAGGSTGLNGPFGIALDAAGRVYVTNYYTPSVAVFAANPSGDVPPTATIAGVKTEMRYPEGIAVLVPAGALRRP